MAGRRDQRWSCTQNNELVQFSEILPDVDLRVHSVSQAVDIEGRLRNVGDDLRDGDQLLAAG